MIIFKIVNLKVHAYKIKGIKYMYKIYIIIRDINIFKNILILKFIN
jgi:hypothetical protein